MTYWFADGGVAPFSQTITVPAGVYKTGASYPATRYLSGADVYFDRPLGQNVDGAFRQQGGVLLATNGVADAQAVTRIQTRLSQFIGRIWALGTVGFTNADVDKINNAPQGSYATLSMFVAPATAFTGIPTAQQIYDYTRGRPENIYRTANRVGNFIQGKAITWKQPGSAQQYEYADGRDVFIMRGPDLADQPNTKMWVLVLPVLIRSRGLDAGGYYVYDSPSWEADKPEFGAPDTTGRAVSIWTNRTPAAPVITSPLNGQVLVASAPLTIAPKDPDAYFGGIAPYQTDMAGVQVQYAPRPTAAQPNPEWIDLPFAREDGSGLGPGFFIENSTYNGGGAPNNAAFSRSALDTFRRNLTITLKVGSNVPTDGQGLLPAGVWQIRVRTFDYGHPLTGPLGSDYHRPPIAGASYTPDTYPNPNKSAWSEPVTVQVAAQVPPPTPLEPIDNQAVPITRVPVLSWQYRNTVQPPNKQKGRTVQIRKVGAPDWSTISRSIVSKEYIPDGSFEKLTIGNWQFNGLGTAGTGGLESFVSTQADPGPRTGFKNFDNAYLTCDRASGATLEANKSNYWANQFPVNDNTYFVMDAWAIKGPQVATMEMRCVFSNAAATVQYGPTYSKATTTAGWQNFRIDNMIRPADANATHMTVYFVMTPVSGGNVAKSAIDDITFRGALTTPTDPVTDALPFYRVGTPSYQFADDGSKTAGWAVSGGSLSVSQERVRAYQAAPGANSTLSATRTLTGVPAGAKMVNIRGFRSNRANTTGVARDITVTIRRGSTVVSQTIKTASGMDRGTYPTDSPWSVSLETGSISEAGFDSITVSMVSGNGEPATLDIDQLDVILLNAEGFAFEVNKQYEWRVQTTDTTDTASNYSTPARFWIVPGPTTGVDRIASTMKIDGATLGRGNNRAFVYTRGGKKRVGEIKNLSSIEWNRTRDDISTATVTVANYDQDGGRLLASLEPWAFEIVIFRETVYGKDRVWEGPITLLTFNEGDREVVIKAKDVMAYAYRRIVKQTMDDQKLGDTVTSRATRVLQNAFGPSDPNILGYLTPVVRTDDARQGRVLMAWSRTAYEEIDDMAANAGLDYCAVGRSIMLWGTKHRIGTLKEFTNDDLGAPPIVSVYGMSMANVYAISNGTNVYGTSSRLDANGDDTRYGLIEVLSSSWSSDAEEETGTFTNEALRRLAERFTQSAERMISDRYPAPVVVRVPDNSTLNPDMVLNIQQLVPGVVIPLRSIGELRKVVANQKLDSVKVTQVSGNETIAVTMSPFSRDDASLEETDV